MIKIRTISYNLPNVVTQKTFDTIKQCYDRWQSQMFFCRTQRMTLPLQSQPFELDSFDDIALACKRIGIRWFNIPIDLWQADFTREIDIAGLLRRHSGAFCNVICTKGKQIREEIIRFACDAIRSVGEAEMNGKANFRFGVSMNVAPNGPFFPFTYSDGKHLGFSIGLELAEEINTILKENPDSDLCELRTQLCIRIEKQVDEIEKIASDISSELEIEFHGIDFSLAPLPEDGSSVISAVASLGVSDINSTGMMFGTAFYTDTLKYLASRHKSVGFSGVMYSLLEDKEYADINDKHGFSIDRMIALSTMCGCGVDMVPIDKTVSDASLRSILIEVGCISSRLNKPLGVRLLPVAFGSDGRTHIDENKDFIVNTRIVPLTANTVRRLGDQFRYLSF